MYKSTENWVSRKRLWGIERVIFASDVGVVERRNRSEERRVGKES